MGKGDPLPEQVFLKYFPDVRARYSELKHEQERTKWTCNPASKNLPVKVPESSRTTVSPASAFSLIMRSSIVIDSHFCCAETGGPRRAARRAVSATENTNMSHLTKVIQIVVLSMRILLLRDRFEFVGT